MTEAQILRRRIRMKKDALPLFREELSPEGFRFFKAGIRQNQWRLALLEIKENLEGKIAADFDRTLSLCLDAVITLLESEHV